MVNSLVLKHYTELQELLDVAADSSPYLEAKLADNRVELFLHFALYAVCKIDYKRVGILKKGKRIRKGASGTRDATCDLTRVPPDKHPIGPPLPNNIIVRYFDLSRTRKDWRSFYRKNFISINAVKSDKNGRWTTDFTQLINEGQVPPPPLTLSRTEKRKLNRIIRKKNVKKVNRQMV